MKSIKKLVRNIVLPLAVRFKLEKILLSLSGKSLCIINFHGVKTDGSMTLNNRHLPQKEFEKIIKYLSQNFKIVTLSELFELYRNKTKPSQKTIALTFDDGFENNFSCALPILKKYNVPATYYLISDCLTSSNYIAWPELFELIRIQHQSDIEVNGFIFKKGTLFNESLNLYLVEYFKTLGSKTYSTVLSIFEKYQFSLAIPPKYTESIVLITAEKLKSYAYEPLITYGSHTHTHPCLAYLNEEDTLQELTKSKESIENIIGKSIDTIAFPDGSYTHMTLEASIKAGFKNLTAVNYLFQENNTNPNLLSRFTISNSTTFESNMIRLAKEYNKFGI